MNRVRRWSGSVVAVGAVLAWNAPARSQVIIDGQHASDNVTVGAVAARAPGNMVNAGVLRAQEAAAFARDGIEIVETTRPQSPRAAFLVDAIKIIFEQLNKTLLELGNILLQRAGLSPLIPQNEVVPPADNGGTDTVDTGDGTVSDGTDVVDTKNPR